MGRCNALATAAMMPARSGRHWMVYLAHPLRHIRFLVDIVIVFILFIVGISGITGGDSVDNKSHNKTRPADMATSVPHRLA